MHNQVPPEIIDAIVTAVKKQQFGDGYEVCDYYIHPLSEDLTHYYVVARVPISKDIITEKHIFINNYSDAGLISSSVYTIERDNVDNFIGVFRYHEERNLLAIGTTARGDNPRIIIHNWHTKENSIATEMPLPLTNENLLLAVDMFIDAHSRTQQPFTKLFHPPVFV